MNAEIISVGTELLLGQTINTDATEVARALSDIGVNLLFTSTVGDNPERLTSLLEQAFRRSELVITTGGLGPTRDDLTKETIARVAGRKLVIHEASLAHIRAFFQHRPEMFGKNQKKMAWLPEGCTVLENRTGTAPGCVFETEAGVLVVMLPGPPAELIPMLYEQAIPFLAKREQAVIVSKNIHVFGIGEAKVAEMIDDLLQGANPTAATYAKNGEMFVRVTARAETKEEAEQMCEPLVREIAHRIGDSAYGIDVDSLEALVVQELSVRNWRIATAESCTGGLLAKRITDIAGASAVFDTGVVSYANQTKERLLGVSAETLRRHGAVSSETAREMAQGVRRLAKSELGVGITGIAGPAGGTEEKPVGLVYIALSDGKETVVETLPMVSRSRGRGWIRLSAASYALDMVRRYLEGRLAAQEDPVKKTGVFTDGGKG